MSFPELTLMWRRNGARPINGFDHNQVVGLQDCRTVGLLAVPSSKSSFTVSCPRFCNNDAISL